MPRNKTQGTSIPGCCLDQQLPGIAGRVATFRHLQVMMRGIRIPRLGLHQIQMIMDPPPGHRHVHAGLIDLPDPGDNMAGIHRRTLGTVPGRGIPGVPSWVK